MIEKVAVAKSRNSNGTLINFARYENVRCSRGSVIPFFTMQFRDGQPMNITDPAMVRFMMTSHIALVLVLYAFDDGKPGESFVQKAPASFNETLASALIILLGQPQHDEGVLPTCSRTSH